MGRMGQAAENCQAVVFLCSDMLPVTLDNLVIDGVASSAMNQYARVP